MSCVRTGDGLEWGGEGERRRKVRSNGVGIGVGMEVREGG